MEPKTLSRRAEVGLGRCHGAPRKEWAKEKFRAPKMTAWKQNGRGQNQILLPAAQLPRNSPRIVRPEVHPLPLLFSLSYCFSLLSAQVLNTQLGGSTHCPGGYSTYHSDGD
jgi:hypothetical protein